MRARGAGLSGLRVNTWAWVLRSGPKANFVTFNTCIDSLRRVTSHVMGSNLLCIHTYKQNCH